MEPLVYLKTKTWAKCTRFGNTLNKEVHYETECLELCSWQSALFWAEKRKKGRKKMFLMKVLLEKCKGKKYTYA